MCRKEVLIGDLSFPKALLELKDPPQKLFFKGNVELLKRPCISVIGARKATPYGRAVAEMIGRIAAESGVLVVSGGAIGCDAYAARAALSSGGATILVAGCGAEEIYPQSSKDLYKATESGKALVVSEYPWRQKPRRFAFVRRNRIIAALSPVLVVCEAAASSGTMSTAETATTLSNCELYAVPGSIFSKMSVGTNRLIEMGARMLVDETSIELMFSLHYGTLRKLDESVDPQEGSLLSALIANPMRSEDLARYLNLDILEVLRALNELEGLGILTRLIDGRYSPTSDYLQTRRSQMSC